MEQAIKVSEETGKIIELKKKLIQLQDEVYEIIASQYSLDSYQKDFSEAFNQLNEKLSCYMVASIDEQLATIKNEGKII